MNTQTIWDLIEIIENDEQTTYEGILKGQPYDAYMRMELKAKYDLMQYANDNNIMFSQFDIETAKQQDKQKYDQLKWK